MKTKHILIALAIIAALSMVSCGNNKKSQNQEPTQEEVQEMKQALADSVLAEIDALAEQYWDKTSKCLRFQTLELSDAEKLIKPDYLLDPSVADNLVTKSQKVNALAIYCVEYGIRKIYDMPLEETEDVIARLVAELNHPIDAEVLEGKTPRSEKVKREYEICKERGDLAYFWQFHYAGIVAINYIISQNPELYFSKISEEQWQASQLRFVTLRKAIEELAEYDEDMEQLWAFLNGSLRFAPYEEMDRYNETKELAKQFRINNKDRFAARRNALLQ